MFNNFLKVIFRYLLRSRFFSALNVLGLSIGLACCVIVFLFIRNELSYDRFHSDGDHIYRVIRQSSMGNMPYNIGVTSGPYADALKTDYGDRINSVTRAFPFNGLVQFQEKSFIEEKLLLADKNFFRFFDYPLAYGDPNTVLEEPGNIVVSRDFSIKYFGEENSVGKMIRIDNEHDLQVTGILDKLPGNAHLQFDAVGSIALIEKESWFNEWWNNALNTYVKVSSEPDVAFLQSSFPDFMEKYFGDDFQRVGNRIGLTLEPLQEIYFNYDTRYDQNITHGDKRYIYIFGTIGVMLILMAAMNYINLATAQTSQRAKEVGIRKTLGSSRSNIALQFLSESFMLCLFSLFIGLALAQVAIPLFNSSFGISIPDIFSDRQLWYFLPALLIVIALMAGAYPSFLLTSLRPVLVMKGVVKSELQYLFIRKTLVVFQFSISVFMIMATFFIGEQLTFMREKDLGFSPNKVVLVRLNSGVIRDARLSFKERLLGKGDFESVSLASGHPGGFYDASTVTIQGEEENIRMRTLWTDEDFLNTMNIELVAGRFFMKETPADSASSVVLNETAVREIGWTMEEAIGKRIQVAQFDSLYKTVVGVIKDYHFTSVKQKIEPLILACSHDGGNALIKLEGNDLQRSVASLEELWNTYQTGFPLEMTFLDETLNRMYKSESVQAKMFSIFSSISLFIACLGIFGLATFIAAQRKKEIGVRKVLGATVNQLAVLLMRDLLKLVLLANLIAIPLGYWAIGEWSSNFAYRVTLSPTILLGGSAIIIVISLVIVGANASKTAMEDPVKSLRPE